MTWRRHCRLYCANSMFQIWENRSTVMGQKLPQITCGISSSARTKSQVYWPPGQCSVSEDCCYLFNGFLRTFSSHKMQVACKQNAIRDCILTVNIRSINIQFKLGSNCLSKSPGKLAHSDGYKSICARFSKGQETHQPSLFYFYCLKVKHFLLFMLLQLSQLPPFAPLPPACSPFPQSIPTLLFMSMGHAYVFFAYQVLNDIIASVERMNGMKQQENICICHYQKAERTQGNLSIWKSTEHWGGLKVISLELAFQGVEG